MLAAAGLGAGAAMSFVTGRFAGIILLAIMALGSFVVTSGYFLIFEIAWNGQTPGKRALGVRVIRESGYPLRPVDSVIRNVVRIADWIPFFYGLGVLVMLVNKRSKRLGDFAAGTIVVREGTPRTLSTVAAVAPETDAQPLSVGLSTADATLVRDFLVRRDSMHPQARADLARRLANALSQRYAVPQTSDPESFLERLTG